jgi:alkylglycerol monooxygenase
MFIFHMKLNLLAFAVPLFLLFMLIEYVAAKRKKLPYFRLHNSLANISVGIAERLLDVFVTGSFFFLYDFLQRHYGVFKIGSSLLLWVLLFIMIDFVWYWYHRMAHTINLFWAAHVVHHQSEDFNYTTSARITVFQAVIRMGFWSVLPLLGFPAPMITSLLLLHGVYPFFIHTRFVKNLGILEYIFVTPSHHRVHHASNEKYLDKNFGDVLIIWDKLFGTFQKEEDNEEIKYGLTHNLNSYSFLWQHLHFPVEMAFAFKKQRGWKKKLRVLFGKPEQLPEGVREEAEKAFLSPYRSSRPQELPLSRYVIWQIAISLAALFFFILLEYRLGLAQQWLVVVCILITLINCGAIMEQKRWIVYLELSRLVLASGALLYAWYNPWLFMLSLAVLALVILYFHSIQRHYLRWVYAAR